MTLPSAEDAVAMARVLAACVIKEAAMDAQQIGHGTAPGQPLGFHLSVSQEELDAPPSADMPRVKVWRDDSHLHVVVRWELTAAT